MFVNDMMSKNLYSWKININLNIFKKMKAPNLFKVSKYATLTELIPASRYCSHHSTMHQLSSRINSSAGQQPMRDDIDVPTK